MTDALANPLLARWDGPFGLPPFAAIRVEHFAPALEAALAEHLQEVRALADAETPPTFENTIVAFDCGGRALERIGPVFFTLAASCTSPALQAVEREFAPRLFAHYATVRLDARLFARVDAVYARRDALGLPPEAKRLVERTWLDFVHAGARLPADARQRIGEIEERLAALSTQFRQNLLADETEWLLVLHGEADLAGLPADVRTAARAAAAAHGVADAWAITLSRSLVVPFLAHSDRRDLRERAFVAWTRRGEHDGPHDNRPLVREIVALRHELARLHGYATFADFALVDRMAGTPVAVAELLARVWAPACAKAAAEREALAAAARERGDASEIAPWDWRYYAEKVRAARHRVDEAALKPYFALDRMQAAAFDCARRLFGVVFVPREDLAGWHPDVRVYEVRGRDDATIGVFLADHFARPGKRSGAWMSSLRMQSRAAGDVLPVVGNHNNFARAPAGEPTLLSADDVRTLFHEFGHGLHGLLSNVTYERLSGANVLRDFVEMPSQLFEHWAFEPEVLRRHARHCVTGEPIPDALIARVREARGFSQGFDTVEYTASALVDMALHAHPDPGRLDPAAFEAAELTRLRMPKEIVMRHRLPHFTHLFSGAYAAGYYVYMWAEVLDADAYTAFVEAGDPFDPATAERLYRYVYSAGASLDPMEAFRAFRGREPRVEPMLAERGLSA
ncbi:MAG: M3 family metallopeptidase [Betaproteobacteria bacterium]|nr:M3 family metallopeptidase [Betaproteobacteria bacterium]